MKKRILSFIIVLAIFSTFSIGASAAVISPKNYADNLYQLGLFKGVGTDKDGKPIYELDRAPTRYEALVMLIRLLGKEKQALSNGNYMPFKDVADWAKPYVSYAYTFDYTTGTSYTTFSGEETVTASQYLTFVLRALGYESGKQFNWDTAWTLSDPLGLTSGEYKDGSHFTRGDAAKIAYNALSQTMSTGSYTLMSFLKDTNAVTLEAIAKVGLSDKLNPKVMGSSEIFAKFNYGVLHIKSYDNYGKVISEGSGYLIWGPDNAQIYTNYNLVKNAYGVSVTFPFTNKTYFADYISAYREDCDIAKLLINRNFFHTGLGGPSADVVKDAEVFALDNSSVTGPTIAKGTINTIGIGKEAKMIFTGSLPTGSTGGPLLNTYGEVVGIISNADGKSIVIPKADMIMYQSSSPIKLYSPNYPENPSAPDFGAYFGVAPIYRSVQDGHTTYLYEASALYSEPNIMARYEDLLKKWGYTDKKDYNANGVTGFFYTKGTKPVFIGKITNEGQEYYMLMLY